MSLKWLKGLDLFKVCLVLMVLKCKMCFDVLKWPCLDGAPLWWGGHFSLPTHLVTRPLLSNVLKLDHCCQKYWDSFTIVKIIETLPLLINLICCITVALVVVLHQIGLERSPGWLLIWYRVVGDMGRLYSISLRKEWEGKGVKYL